MAFGRRARAWMLPHFIALSLFAVMVYATLAWGPTLMIRRHGWTASSAALTLGALFAVIGPVSAATGGWLMRRMRERGIMDGGLRIIRWAALFLTLALGSLGLPSGSSSLAVAALAVSAACITIPVFASTVAVQEATPGALRGRIAAGYFLITNLIGGAGGPLIAAVLTSYLYRSPAQIGASLATVAVTAGPIVIVLLTIAMRPYRALLAPYVARR